MAIQWELTRKAIFILVNKENLTTQSMDGVLMNIHTKAFSSLTINVLFFLCPFSFWLTISWVIITGAEIKNVPFVKLLRSGGNLELVESNSMHVLDSVCSNLKLHL